jgi:hypothetical protein
MIVAVAARFLTPPFDRLRARWLVELGMSTTEAELVEAGSRRSQAALRQAQGAAFDRLRAPPSTGSGRRLRQAQGAAFDRLRARWLVEAEPFAGFRMTSLGQFASELPE